MNPSNRISPDLFGNPVPPALDPLASQQADFPSTFQLTRAVRPASDSQPPLTQGYRHDTYVDEASNASVSVVMASVSRKRLFSLFMHLVERLGSVVDVVLESSHRRSNGEHADFYRENIDMPVLSSILWDYEDLLLNDGCTGIAVLNPKIPQEIQFEEHKLLIVYGSPLEGYEFLMEKHGVSHCQEIKFITEGEHIHCSSDYYFQQFQSLRTDLGLDGSQNEYNQEKNKKPGEDWETFGDDFPWGNDDNACGGLM